MSALSPSQARLALVAVTDAAVAESSRLVSADAAQTRQALFDVVPSTIAYYSDGSSALAADYYDDLRQDAAAPGRFRAEPVVNLRWGNPKTEEKIRTGILWSVQPLLAETPDLLLAKSRVGEVVQIETARPFRDTITTNRRRDPAAAGWQRVAHGGACKFCQFLAGRGVIYKESSARFASHPGCGCGARVVFLGQPGEEASVMQYVASKRRAGRTPEQRKAINELLASMP
jgi:hypothetical protein